MSKEDTIFNAKLAEQAERYEDMVKCMKEIVAGGQELSNEERNLLSVAYKNWIGGRRTAWRSITAIEQKEEAKNSPHLKLLRAYKAKVEDEVEKIANDTLELVDKYLLPKATKPDNQVFYLKMKGDYCRYFAECVTGDRQKKAGEKAHEAYKAAMEKAGGLASTSPIKLGLALNFSVFYYEILNSPEDACKLAKTTFDGAIGDLNSLEDEDYKEAATIMQLLRDNLTLWGSEAEEENGAPKEENL